MELTYSLSGDYYLPDIILSDLPDATPLGRYGRLHKRYLQEHCPILYNQLLLAEWLKNACEQSRTKNRRTRLFLPNWSTTEYLQKTAGRLHGVLLFFIAWLAYSALL
ncbi:TnpV protein [Lachnospiraceae bacterium ZAX-1]